MHDWIPDRNPSPGPLRTTLYGALTACALVGALVAGAVVEVITRAWPAGGKDRHDA